MTTTPKPAPAITYKPLAVEFTRRGRLHTQVKRSEHCAIYELKEKDWPSPGYEVIHIRRLKAREMFGEFVEAHEAYPSNEDWGRYGWTSLDAMSADLRFKRLVKTLEARNEGLSGAKIVEKPEDEGQGKGDDLGELSGPGCETCGEECESCQ